MEGLKQLCCKRIAMAMVWRIAGRQGRSQETGGTLGDYCDHPGRAFTGPGQDGSRQGGERRLDHRSILKSQPQDVLMDRKCGVRRGVTEVRAVLGMELPFPETGRLRAGRC